MGKIKEKLAGILYAIRNPHYDENEQQYQKNLSSKRLLILAPFVAIALILMLLYLTK